MKNKKLSWFLLPAVLTIWAVIGWKVYAAMSDSETPSVPENEFTVAEKESVVIPDTYNLLLDYRDPFLDKPAPEKKVVVHNSKSPEKTKPEIKKQESAVLAWPVIRYSGLVKQPKDDRTLGFLTVDDKSHFVKSGDVIGTIVVGKVWRDSVEVRRGKERKVIGK